jgi:predicted RNase H-like HicB family nuclease
LAGALEALRNHEAAVRVIGIVAMKTLNLTALLEKEGDGFVSLCPEVDVASQGRTVEEALANLKEAVELFLECAAPEEVQQRYKSELSIT